MSDFSVNKYTVKEYMVLLGHLFLIGDEIYIQSTAGQRSVFTGEKELLGSISSKTYLDIKNQLEEV